jgi:hypothetical protein
MRFETAKRAVFSASAMAAHWGAAAYSGGEEDEDSHAERAAFGLRTGPKNRKWGGKQAGLEEMWRHAG